MRWIRGFVRVTGMVVEEFLLGLALGYVSRRCIANAERMKAWVEQDRAEKQRKWN